MASVTTKTEKIEKLIPTLVAIAKRHNVSASVAVIDKVPPSIDEFALSNLAQILITYLGVVFSHLKPPPCNPFHTPLATLLLVYSYSH